MRLSYADIFQHNTSYQAHCYLFHSMIRILKMESETFCRRDETRIVSLENSFARNKAGKTWWLAADFLWLCWSRASARSIECTWQRFTSWISLSTQRTTDAELCVVLSKRWMEYPEILAHKFIFCPWPWKHFCHWNKSVIYSIIVSQAI